jgi:hypothetical protein
MPHSGEHGMPEITIAGQWGDEDVAAFKKSLSEALGVLGTMVAPWLSSWTSEPALLTDDEVALRRRCRQLSFALADHLEALGQES